MKARAAKAAFVDYASQDAKVAQWVVAALSAFGVKRWS
jgi:hypothetical protein